jgi:hypothetical protein
MVHVAVLDLEILPVRCTQNHADLDLCRRAQHYCQNHNTTIHCFDRMEIRLVNDPLLENVRNTLTAILVVSLQYKQNIGVTQE